MPIWGLSRFRAAGCYCGALGAPLRPACLSRRPIGRFGGEPLRNLSGLKRFLYANALSQLEGSSFKLIGPSSSALLEDMVKERQKFVYAAPYRKAFGQLSEKAIWPGLYDVQFYAYGATADNCLLPMARRSTFWELQEFTWKEPSQPKGPLPAA
jgi:hypothetical protein